MKVNSKRLPINSLTFKTTLAAAFTLAGALACAGEDPNSTEQTDEERVGEVNEAISGGSVVSSNVAPFTSIVKLGGCSATKVSSRWYLTAWHCGFQAGAAVTVSNSNAGTGGTSHNITQVVNHPTTLGLTNGLGFDLAMVQLDTTNAIPSWTPTYTVQDPSSGRSVGFGCDSINAANGGKKQFADYTTIHHPGAGANPYAFWSNGTNPQICPGDSGGPFFRIVNGTYRLSGVNSYYGSVPGSAGAGSGFARTYPAFRWIEAVRLNQAGKNDFSTGVTGSFINLWSNYCLRANGSIGTDAKQDACYMASDTSQRFQVTAVGGGFYEFRNSFTGGCMAIKDASVANAALVTTRTCDGSDTTRWSVNGNSDFNQIINKKSGKCLHTQATALGAAIDQNVCLNLTDYLWNFSK